MDENLVKKVKDIASGTLQAGGVISRRQIANIAKDVVRTNNPNILRVWWDCRAEKSMGDKRSV